MEEDLVAADSDLSSTRSPSSVLPHFSSEEILDNNEEILLEEIENKEKNGRTRKILQKYNIAIPELKCNFKNYSTQDNKAEKVDLSLSNEKIDPWFIKKFSLVKKRAKPLQFCTETQKRGVTAQRQIQKELQTKLAIKRKKEQEKRRELYAEDNEDVFDNVEDKLQEENQLSVVSDNDIEDEDDFPNDTDEEKNLSKDILDNIVDEKHQELTDISSLKESGDIFSGETPIMSDCSTQPNVFPVSESTPIDTGSQFPPSLSQWYSPKSEKRKSSVESLSDEDAIEELNQSSMKNQVDMDDLLMYCSGQFNVSVNKPQENSITKVDDILNDEVNIIRPSNKNKTFFDSDDEDQDVNPTETRESSRSISPTEKQSSLRKTVFVSDDEDDNVEDGDEAELAIEENDIESDHEDEDSLDGEQPPNGDGSDDELAVFRRIEHQEYKRKLKKKRFFDDEASLSGSDVGSDASEDEDENNEYEADECDKEEFNQEELREKNHKLFLRQQQQEQHREIAKLQERLLADGDLAGIETNRTFRIRLREDVEIDMQEINQMSQDGIIEDDPEDDKKRLDVIKFKAEMHQLLSQTQNEQEDDEIERAAKAAVLAEVMEDYKMRETATLIGKSPLTNIFKDMNGVKQMYSNAIDVQGGTKRIGEPVLLPQKKSKLLESIDD